MGEKPANHTPIEERLALPDFSDEVFEAITRVAQKVGLFEYFAGGELDEIYRFWVEDLDELVEGNIRMERALQLPGIPLAEAKHAGEYHADRLKLTEAITGSIQSFFRKEEEEREWEEDGKPIYEAIERYIKDGLVGCYEDSITALLEAISETRDKFGTEAEMRQRIAQHLVEEIFKDEEYEGAYNAAEVNQEASIIDDIEIEKEEFDSALKRKMWTGGGDRRK